MPSTSTRNAATRRSPPRRQEKQGEEFADPLAWLGQVLGEDVTEARLSSRLTDSAACLVGDAYSMSPQLEKLYRASGQPVPP